MLNSKKKTLKPKYTPKKRPRRIKERKTITKEEAAPAKQETPKPAPKAAKHEAKE